MLVRLPSRVLALIRYIVRCIRQKLESAVVQLEATTDF